MRPRDSHRSVESVIGRAWYPDASSCLPSRSDQIRPPPDPSPTEDFPRSPRARRGGPCSVTNGYHVLEEAGIILSLTFSGYALLREDKSRRISNLLALTAQHRENLDSNLLPSDAHANPRSRPRSGHPSNHRRRSHLPELPDPAPVRDLSCDEGRHVQDPTIHPRRHPLVLRTTHPKIRMARDQSTTGTRLC